MSGPVAAIRALSGSIPIPVKRRENVVLSADQNDFSPTNWFKTHDFLFQVSADRKITGFARAADLDAGNLSGNPAAHKRIWIPGAPTNFVHLRIMHQDGLSSPSNQVNCPHQHALMVQPGDSFGLLYDNAEWNIIDVGRGSPWWITDVPGAAQIGWNPTGWAGADVVRANPAAAAVLHGLEHISTFAQVGDFLVHKKTKRIINVSAFTLTLPNESATETTAARRILTPGGGSVGLAPGETVDVWYDEDEAAPGPRWRIV